MFSIFKKDVLAFFNSLIGYITIGLFLLVTGFFLWVFPDTSILSYGYATLENFFTLAPYIFMFLIPAISMKTIAGERSEGTYEWLITKPIDILQLIAAKYWSCMCIVVLAIIPTAIYYVSIYLLGASRGNIDTGEVIGSYLGLLLLGSTFCAIGVFSSSISKNSVVAFLIGAFLSFAFFIGFDYLNTLVSTNWLSEAFLYIGIQSHYESVSRGLLDIRDLVYFISLNSVFLTLAYTFVKKNHVPIRALMKQWVVVFLAVAFLNVLVTYIIFRIDFTSEKRFTLSTVSKNVLRSISDDLRIVVFLDGDLPSGFRRLKDESRSLLADLKSYSGGQIKYTFINPLSEADNQEGTYVDVLAERGIEPVNLSVKTEEGLTQKLIFPVAVLLYGEEELPIQLLQQNRYASPEEVLNNSVQNLEYSFINGIKKVLSGGKPIVAFTEGHGELSDWELYDAMHSLGTGYQVGRLNLDSISYETLRQIQVMVVAKPNKAFSEQHKFKIDYFVQHGGKMLWAVNQVAATLDSMRTSGAQVATARTLNLDDVFFKYGVRLNYDLLADLNCAQIPMRVGNLGETDQLQLVPWLFYPVFVPRSTHAIVKNIDAIKGEFVGTLDTVATPAIHKDIILNSSPFSKILSVPAAISLDMAAVAPDPNQFKSKPHPVGVVLKGGFPSIFKNRAAPEGILDTFSYRKEDTLSSTKMIVLSDGNLLKNEINQQEKTPYALGWDRATQQQYGNKTLLLNMIDYLNGEEGIISLREKEVKLRLLDKALIKRDKLRWQFVNVGLPIVLLLIVGLCQQLWRKRRYGRKNCY